MELLRGLASAVLALLSPGRSARSDQRDPSLRSVDFVAIDTETTGLDPERDVVVALAAVPFVGGHPRPEAGYTRLVNPGRPIPEEARAIHGIDDDEVRDAPPLEAVVGEFVEACHGRPLVAHTAWFDLTLINRAARRAGLAGLQGPVLDIGELARALFPSWWDLTLEGLGRLTEVEMVGRHTATGDALTAGNIFVRLIPLLEQHRVRTLSHALAFQRRAFGVPGGPGATGGGLAGP